MSGPHHHGLSSSEQSLKWLVPINVSPYAVVSCYSGLLGLFLFLPSIIAIPFGIIALRDLKRKPYLSGKGRAWFGLITGSIPFVIFLVIIIMWAVSPDP